MAEDLDTRPAFGDLLKQSQSALAGLQALEEQLSTRLADQHAQLKATRSELEEAKEAITSLRGAHERLGAEHARTLEEIVHHRQARAELEATILDMRHELAGAFREREELVGARDRERQELENRLARQETTLAERLSRIGALEAQLDQQAAAQVSWQAERDSLLESREQLSGRLRDLEAAQRQWQDDLARAISNREELRAVFEELKQTHATATERSAAAFRDMVRLQEEVRITAEHASRHEQAVALLREELAGVKANCDELQTHQLTWAADREGLLAAAQAAEKARSEAQAQVARLLERAQTAAQEWGARRESMTEENLRLTEALTAARQAERAAEDSERQLQARLQQLEQAHGEKIATLEARLRSAEDAATRPLTQEEAHRINSRLNAIVGFANILLEPRKNLIGASEQSEFMRLIDENSRGLAADLRLVPVVGAAGASEQLPPGVAGPSVASLKGSPTPPAVLVADRDQAVREAIAPFLTRAGYTVAYASTRQEALGQANALSPLVILVEAELPPGGASALMADLKRDARTADIPVVVTTRNADQPLGVDLGQVDVLSKPIDRQQLLQMMINHDLEADARRAQKLPARVLVIDDDPLSLRLLSAVLKPLQIEVITASGGKAGLELAKRSNPELIICDLTMPEVDGFSVIAALRADPQTSSVPIIVYTGKSITTEDQQRLQGMIPSIIRKGEFSRERFLEMLLKRGERRSRGTPPVAA